jgi:type IV secretion system protein VirB5
MSVVKYFAGLFAVLLIGGVSHPAHAQIPVTDVGAIIQLVTEVNTLEQELNTARQHLAQAQQQYQSMTGARGMEMLLAGTVRNYLPTNAAQLQVALQGAGGSYALSADVRAAVAANAVLTAQQIAALAPGEQDAVHAARGDAALEQAVAQEALANSSSRFASIQTLIDAIPRATDQKGILELAARIDAEEGMLQNEQTKLNVIDQAAQGAEWARRQRAREHAVADIGSLRNLPAMGL